MIPLCRAPAEIRTRRAFCIDFASTQLRGISYCLYKQKRSAVLKAFHASASHSRSLHGIR